MAAAAFAAVSVMKKPSKPKPLKLLGHSAARFPSAPDQATLEVFPNRNTARPYWITFETSEFTSLCPVTGQPDFATITIRYVPAEVCVETKSLKFYLSSYRSTPSFGEDVANRILEDLVAVLKPERIHVNAAFSPRGGISLTIDAEYPDPLICEP
jgi:7-cyano-7-deazaguanine reductase